MKNLKAWSSLLPKALQPSPTLACAVDTTVVVAL